MEPISPQIPNYRSHIHQVCTIEQKTHKSDMYRIIVSCCVVNFQDNCNTIIFAEISARASFTSMFVQKVLTSCYSFNFLPVNVKKFPSGFTKMLFVRRTDSPRSLPARKQNNTGNASYNKYNLTLSGTNLILRCLHPHLRRLSQR